MKPNNVGSLPEMPAESKVLKIGPVPPFSDAIRKAAAAIAEGGAIAFPTCCLYGLGVDAFDAKAVQRLYAIKRRSTEKPVLVLIDRIQQLKRLAVRVPKIATQIMRLYWPGRVTLVFEATAVVPAGLTGGSRKIGIRQPGHPAAAELVKTVGRPITGTSANISGKPGCHRVEDLDPALTRHLDLILDAGPLAGGVGSTVVDVTAETPRVLREGIIPAHEIMALTAR